MPPNDNQPSAMSFEEVEQKLATLLAEVQTARQDIGDEIAPDLDNVASRVDAICGVALSLHSEQVSQLQPNLLKLREELVGLSSVMTEIMKSTDISGEPRDPGDNENDPSAKMD